MTTTQKEEWFTEYYGIDIPDYDLEFLDFNLNSDVPLYIDPFAITKLDTEFAVDVHNTIVSYFLVLKKAVESGDKALIKQITSGRWSEPKEIYLGVGKKPRTGKGLGKKQEESVIESLSKSKVIKEGKVESIQELELFIEGIGPDKISDLVANIILGKLAEFTQKMAAKYGFETRPVALNGYWNEEESRWDSGYFNLPTRDVNTFVLVPRLFVRREKDLMNHRDFYNKYILEVLKRELLTANDSLVETLATGIKRVTKSAIKKDTRFKISKEYISEFIMSNPQVLRDYREDLMDTYNPIDPLLEIDEEQVIDEGNDLIDILKGIKPGNTDHVKYEKHIFNALRFVFDSHLTNFEEQYVMDGDRGRIDIIASNVAATGAFYEFKERFNAYDIPIECKNYTNDIGNTEYNQLVDRMGEKTSNLGILICRDIADTTALFKHCTDRYLRNKHMIVVLNDEDMVRLIEYRMKGNYIGIENFIAKKIRDISYGH